MEHKRKLLKTEWKAVCKVKTFLALFVNLNAESKRRQLKLPEGKE